ncbi:MAG: PAS domain S-box protein [Verrucomicrobiota bacterium]
MPHQNQTQDKSEPAPTPVLSKNSGTGIRLFECVVEYLAQPVFFKDCSSTYVSVNAAFAVEFGLKPMDFIGKTDFNFFSKEMAEQYRADDQRVFSGGQTITQEEAFLVAGRQRTIKVIKTPVIDDAGNVIGLVGIFHDSAESIQAAEHLRISEQEFRRVWENSLDGMRLTDEEGMILLVNDAFCRMVGMPQVELVGKPFSVIYEAKHRQASLAKHKERFAARDVQPLFERELLLWHGGKVWFELSNSFLEIKGHPTHLLSIFRDITERKIAEEKMHDFAGRLERSNRELQDFAYVASHDLQEPLRKVAVFSDRLKIKFGATLGDEGVDYVNRMQKATVRMQTLITDLLSFSRVTSKSQPFVRLDLGSVVTEVLADLEARTQQVGAEIQVGQLPAIEAEPLQMRQLFQNLIGNALKFSRPNEKPLVRIEGTSLRDKLRWREIDGSPREMVRLIVRDNGIGFDQKYVEKIFQVFQRLHGREAYEGTGMGLAITRKIVEHHGGEITARSKLGEGATFIVILPVTHRKTEK